MDLDEILNNFIFAGLSIEQMSKLPKWFLVNAENNKEEAKAQIVKAIPEKKIMEIEEPRLYQGVGGSSAPFFCSGCQMGEMDIMENYDEQDGRYYCKCSFWDTPHNAFIDKSGGNWLGWKNKQAAQDYLDSLPIEENGYNQAITDIRKALGID